MQQFYFTLNYRNTFSVFWDLYCAAPERRDTCEHSSEAKAFHDYVSTDTFVSHFEMRHKFVETINKYAVNCENENRMFRSYGRI